MQDIDWRNAKRAREELEGEISDFLRKVVDEPEKADGSKIALGLKVSAGLGKTSRTLEMLRKYGRSILTKGHILFYVPTLDLADRAAEDFAKLGSGIPSFVLRGREADNPKTGQPMCERKELVRKITGRVPSITKALCRVEEEGETIAAPCATNCPYFDQWDTNKHSIIFLAHAYLTLPPIVPGPVALRIIDEKFWPSMIQTVTLPLETWSSPGPKDIPGEHEKSNKTVRRTVRHALEDAEPIHTALRDQNITKEHLDILASHASNTAHSLSINPTTDEKEIERQLQQASETDAGAAQTVARIFELLADTSERETTERLSISEEKQGGKRTLLLNAHLLRELPDDAPVLFLDADLDETIVRKFHPGVDLISLHALPQAEIVQISDLTMSTHALTTKPGATELRGKLAEIISREVSVTSERGLETLVVATKKVLKALFDDADIEFDEEAKALPRLHGAVARWFGPRMLGVNDYAKFGTIILIGRLQSDVASMNNDLRAVFGDSDVPLEFARDSRLVRGYRPYQFRSAHEKSGPGEVQVHPDPRGDALLQQMREAQSSQAIARLRLISNYRPGAKRVMNICNIPLLDLPVDHLVDFEELWRGTSRHYEKLKRAVLSSKSGSLQGLRISRPGLVEDAPHEFKAKTSGENFRKNVKDKMVLTTLREVARDHGLAATPVKLSNLSGGGRPTLAVVFTDEEYALQKAEALWPGYAYSVIDWPEDAIQTPSEEESEAVLEAV